MKYKIFSITIMILVLNISFVLLAQHSQKNQPNVINMKTQQEILNDIGFDRTVLLTLMALERNYQFRKRFLSGVHADDYYVVILNTTKRIALADTMRISLPVPAKKDSTKEKESK